MASTGVEAGGTAGKSQLSDPFPHPLLVGVRAYGLFCALLTWAQGDTFTIGGGKSLLIYLGAWLGVSFALLLLFVALATTVKARGIGAILLILLFIGASAGTQFITRNSS
jgi:hypothetical protein